MKKIILMLCIVSSNVFAKYSEHLPRGIKWHTGKVENAFELAKKDKKPLFLYWGAVWCPPCNYIKKNIFTAEIFKQEIKNYIAIYLDGDSKDAQAWGEKLKTLGYPTMLILNSEGQEIMRLPIGVSIDQYVGLMKQSRDNQFVMSERMKRVENGKATDSDWELLAGYSWDQDPNLKAEGLYLKAPEGIYRSKLYFGQLLNVEKPENDPTYFEKIIQDEKLFDANLTHFIDSCSTLFKTIYGDDKEAKIAAAKLLSKTVEKYQTRKLSLYDQVGLYYPIVVTDNIIEGKVTPVHVKQIKAVTDMAGKKSKGIFERQSVMSLSVDLLEGAELYNEAKVLATKELKFSKSPFYFMSSLASIAKAQGDMKGSLKWSKKAWEVSTGANSRFQWGAGYLNKLLDPEYKTLIDKDAPKNKDEILKVIKVGLSNDESFVGRNKGRFEKLGKKISEWSKVNTVDISDMKKSITELCQKNAMKAECTNWVNSL